MAQYYSAMGNKQSDGTHQSFNVLRHDAKSDSHASSNDHRDSRSESIDHVTRQRSTSNTAVAGKCIEEGDALIKAAKTDEEYLKAKQKYTEALESLKDYVSASDKHQHHHHHHHTTALSNVGVLEFAEGRYAEAKELLHEAVEKRRMMVHKDEFQPPNLSALTIAYKKDRVFHRAPSVKIDLEASLLKQHGTVDAMTADLIGNLAVCNQKTGNLEEAKTLHEEALKLKTVVFGEHSLPVADTLHYLAEVNDALGNFTDAVAQLKEALSIEQQVHGSDSPKTITALNNLGVMLVHGEQFQEALPYLERSHAIRAQSLGAEHQLTQIALRNLEFCRDKILDN